VAGTVLSIPVSQGDTISTNTVIATIGNLSDLKVSLAVPERFLANLRIGSRAEVRFDAIPDAAYGARVIEMSPVLESASRTLEVKLGLDRGDPRILAGMFATVRLVTESRKNVLVVPRSAVGITSTEAYVFVVKADENVERRTVALGIETEEAFEVRKGIAPGDKVVTEGRSMLSNGDRVRIVDGEGGAGARP
jgi:RND family efflux transporter MFP subunit